MEKIKITSEYIKLDSFLKLAAATGSGGEAKQLILDGLVSVNGEGCLMRGKKLRSGDRVKLMDKEYTVVSDEDR